MPTPMHHRLQLEIQRQPNDHTCGPTCLQAVYRYYGDNIGLDTIISEIPSFEEGGTLAVMLGRHALRRGYDAMIYTFNLQVFDPTWFHQSGIDLKERLRSQIGVSTNAKLITACEAYVEFLELGGEIRMQDLNAALIRKYLGRSVPILTGLSSTYLYREPREIGTSGQPDDLRGTPSGHFVVFHGYDQVERTVLLADPFLPNPLSSSHHYVVPLDRAVCSILLGIVTYDANLLIIRPADLYREFSGNDS
ncbi:MAG: C39 family peptidase [Planctomycetaceae bacterium]|nr:C39 family peptidase [Planctomycetaceae bacterium]